MTPTRTTSTAFVVVKRSTRGGVGCGWSSSPNTSDNGIMSAIRYLRVGAHVARNSRGWRDRAVVARWRDLFEVWHQPAPFPEMTAAGVASRILTSVQREHVLAY